MAPEYVSVMESYVGHGPRIVGECADGKSMDHLDLIKPRSVSRETRMCCALLVPCRDFPNFLPAFFSHFVKLQVRCFLARTGYDAEHDLVVHLLGTALDGLEDLTGFRREECRLDFYATRIVRNMEVAS